MLWIGVALIAAGVGCSGKRTSDETPAAASPEMGTKVNQYTTYRLATDLAVLADKERQMLPLLIDAAREMDALFWEQAYGNRDSLLAALGDPAMRRFAEINYGPWDRLDDNAPFVPGVGPKPPGATFYPRDMTREEFEAAAAADETLRDQYTVVRRDAAGKLVAVPYHQVYASRLARAADLLRQAAALAEDPGLRRYLELRAEALLTSDYRPSDMAWMDMKSNTIDIVIGPIENYEDALFNYKTAFEAYVLVKDQEWSQRLARYAQFLPALQRGLPVPEAYKKETPGSDADLNAYDAIYYAGDCNAGSKTIAINLPNDEQVQLAKGTRRLQLKNAMRAKFDAILLPIAGILVAEDQRQHVTFDAFFANTMFHEVAHGLGIKNTIDGRDTVRRALREQFSALEEGKADVLGLYMVTELHRQGEVPNAKIEDFYVTFMAGIFRSVRFGASSAHGRANMTRFNFFQEMGAFTRDEASGTYRCDFAKMNEAVAALSSKILMLEGDGNYEAAAEFTNRMGVVSPALQKDLDRLGSAGIPVDIVFEQGKEVLGL